MGANKVTASGLNMEKTGHWGSSFFYHFARRRLVGGCFIGWSFGKQVPACAAQHAKMADTSLALQRRLTDRIGMMKVESLFGILRTHLKKGLK
jgi:hypothetical protein